MDPSVRLLLFFDCTVSNCISPFTRLGCHYQTPYSRNIIFVCNYSVPSSLQAVRSQLPDRNWLRIVQTLLIFNQFYLRSLSSKTSPHSGQNFGGCVGSAGSQPHLSHRYNGAPAGFGFPHSIQNLPLFLAPQLQVHEPGSSGFGLPQLTQNFPVFPVAPH